MTIKTPKVSMEFLRQMGLVSPERLAACEVTVIGAGAIGSSVALALAKMGIEHLTVFDPASIEAHHLASHLYRLRDVGQRKVNALAQIIADYTGVEIKARPEKFSNQSCRGIVISTIGSIDDRNAFWQNSIKLNSTIDMFLDVWLDDQLMHLYAVRPFDPDDIEWYEEKLKTTRSQVSYFQPSTLAISTFLALAAEVGTMVKLVVTEGEIDRELSREHYGNILSDHQSLSLPITVIGAGGIGSPTVLALAKLGAKRLIVYDYDAVEEHNLPNQWYRLRDVGRNKVDALQAIVRDFTGLEIEVRAERFETQPVEGILIVAVDSMDTRIKIFETVMQAKTVDLFLDGRMGGETFYLYTINPKNSDHVRWYRDRLYPSSQAAEIPCSARAIIYTLFGIASEIGLNLHQFACGQSVAKEVIRDLPTRLRERA